MSVVTTIVTNFSLFRESFAAQIETPVSTKIVQQDTKETISTQTIQTLQHGAAPETVTHKTQEIAKINKLLDTYTPSVSQDFDSKVRVTNSLK